MKILLLLGTIVVMIGVVLIYDARPITKKVFSFGDQNDATMGLKIVGAITSLIGMLLVYFNI